ncbi:hypothetical protein CYMTET_52515 [Cymbomonas tetramitiformis]|uniref:Uncharacterized protein n=1 Tax=Cymbomonas tetramitiformis TaxID=36881 RepID=A0AAE0BJZ4_9CHLO|nr:hypothetical protein CYMTET_52515 [Cymbomonas tetramitiformis]
MSSIVNYGGAKLDPTTVEVLVTALAVAAMPVEYAQVVADLRKERRPSLDMLVQRTAHFYVNVVQQSLVPSSGIVGGTVDEETVAVVRALVADRRRQNEEKKFNDGRKLVCPTCSGMHSAEKCWIVNLAGMEEFIKLNPMKAKAARENYARRLKKIAAKKTPEAAVTATVAEATSSSTATKRRTEVSAEELWSLEDREEVPVACSAVVTVGDQKVLCTGEGLEGTRVCGVVNRGEEDEERVQEEYSVRASGGDVCAATALDADRELHLDSMAAKSIFNDLSMFEGAQVRASEAVAFKVMTGEVTTSRGGGYGSIAVWNRVTKKVDVLRVEAQYVPESPFNPVSAVSLEDKFGRYAQFDDRTLKNKVGWCEYEMIRKGKVYVLPEVTVEAALPVVEHEQEERSPVRDRYNWKFTEFEKWNEERGPCHVDLCADENNCQVQEFYSLADSVFSHCLRDGTSMVAAPKRPSQTADKGRVPKAVRKEVEKRQVSVRMGQLTFTDHEAENIDALEDYRKMAKATGRVFLEEATRVEQVVYDLDVLVLHSDNDSTIVSGKAKHEIAGKGEGGEWHRAEDDVTVPTREQCHGGKFEQAPTDEGEGYDGDCWAACDYVAAGDETRCVCDKQAVQGGTCQEKQKVVRSGMVRFDEHMDRYGQLVMSWDPSMVRPLKSLYDCERLDGKFVSAFTGGASIILELCAYVEPKGDEFIGVVKLSSAGGGWFWTPVSVFLEAQVGHLTFLFALCEQVTVNSFYPLFEKVEVQEEVRFANRHVALAAREEKVTGLPLGATEPKGWVQLLKAPRYHISTSAPARQELLFEEKYVTRVFGLSVHKTLVTRQRMFLVSERHSTAKADESTGLSKTGAVSRCSMARWRATYVKRRT